MLLGDERYLQGIVCVSKPVCEIGRPWAGTKWEVGSTEERFGSRAVVHSLYTAEGTVKYHSAIQSYHLHAIHEDASFCTWVSERSMVSLYSVYIHLDSVPCRNTKNIHGHLISGAAAAARSRLRAGVWISLAASVFCGPSNNLRHHIGGSNGRRPLCVEG